MATMLHDAVSVEVSDGVMVATLSHPPVNAISQAVMRGVKDALQMAEEDPSCHAVVITGSGEKAFSAGADITEFATLGAEAIANGQAMTLAMESCSLPILAAVNGIAYGGGCELAMACDIRIAADTARFGQPEVNLGIIPGWGGTQRLPRYIGRSRALELMLLGTPIPATTALELGLVSEVVPKELVLQHTVDKARLLSTKAPLAVKAIKRAVAEGVDLPVAQGLEIERREFLGVFTSDDAKEGAMAFLEKREPQWKGR